MKILLFVLACVLCVPRLAWADPALDALQHQVAELTRSVQQLTATVESQQDRIAELERGKTQVARALPAEPAPLREPGANLSAFNPEIGVIADIVAQSSESPEDGEGSDTITAREVEVVFGHPIDPYSRLDVTLAFPELEEAELEEAYITHWGLPGEIKARVGRLKPKIGKAIPLHRDALETVDEPLVIASYFGAEGLSKTGADLSGFLPLPWSAVTHEITLGALQGGAGEDGAMFGETLRRPTLYGHLKNFWDISDATSLELGATYLTGSSDEDDSFEVHALGLDATAVHFLTPTNKLKWQTELFLQDRDEMGEADGHPYGLYSLLDARLSPRIGLGGRVDWVEPIGLLPADAIRRRDTAWSGFLTFYQSEFARWRLQYRHSEFARGGEDDSVFLQGTFAIGVHKHQLQ